jgi:hypothetical protein
MLGLACPVLFLAPIHRKDSFAIRPSKPRPLSAQLVERCDMLLHHWRDLAGSSLQGFAAAIGRVGLVQDQGRGMTVTLGAKIDLVGSLALGSLDAIEALLLIGTKLRLGTFRSALLAAFLSIVVDASWSLIIICAKFLIWGFCVVFRIAREDLISNRSPAPAFVR